AFSGPVNTESAITAITLRNDDGPAPISLGFLADGSTIVVHPAGPLLSNTLYTLVISDQLRGSGGSHSQAYSIRFKTVMEDLQVTAIEIGGTSVGQSIIMVDVPLDLDMTIRFSGPLDAVT